MGWIVEIADEFEPEFDSLHENVQIEMLASARLLERFGPQLKRPRADTLNGSRHANMKELRFSAHDGEWRVRLPSTQGARPSFSWLETSPVSERSSFTAS